MHAPTFKSLTAAACCCCTAMAVASCFCNKSCNNRKPVTGKAGAEKRHLRFNQVVATLLLVAKFIVGASHLLRNLSLHRADLL